ncbi:LPS assembly lipoprotein LptE [Coraliomargarita sp. SDUM461004]|uniref:LPS assembly lipoprotein LptE n=1 Tax=Thalassobacterium sedimentorum TaxID=3041258 RepID=A0ABU1AH69_9BACT|nr:LPS assembly lipoprotein LptE [Coraliomargarita sp. SDUM461004]MDQ8193131.1 LPS assembly lipoprotein LptE [Coraliomargarita sp. SDUM461004]
MKMLPHALRATLLVTFTVLATAFTSACKSYQLGNPTELPFKTIYIKPVSNDSFAPQAQALLSTQIRSTFIRDGRTQLVTSAETADAVLLVNLTEYQRAAAATRSDDTATAADFDLTLSAEVSLFNQNKGDYFFQERIIEETSHAYVSNPYQSATSPETQDFLQSEYQAMSLLTRDLARKITDEVLSPWEAK